jgi:hypothetical protein
VPSSAGESRLRPSRLPARLSTRCLGLGSGSVLNAQCSVLGSEPRQEAIIEYDADQLGEVRQALDRTDAVAV